MLINCLWNYPIIFSWGLIMEKPFFSDARQRLVRLVRYLSGKHIGIHAAGAGYFIVLSIFPLLVLILSLSYIPFRRIAYSLLTVVLSGQIIGIIQKTNAKGRLH